MDLQLIRKVLKANGWEFVHEISKADKIFLGTCAFSSEFEDQAFGLIEAVKEANINNAEIVVCGCLSDINRERLGRLGNFRTVDPRSLDKINHIIQAEVGISEFDDVNELDCSMVVPWIKYPEIVPNELTTAKIIYRIKSFLKERAKKILDVETFYTYIYRKDVFHIRIARGCMGSCSYCAVRFALGPLKSKPPEEVVREFQKGIDAGYREFCLTAGDVGCYGLDISTDLVELLRALFQIHEDCEISLADTNLKWFMMLYDRFMELLKERPGRIKYIQLPIQSGSDKILERMQRGYNTRDIYKAVEGLRTIDQYIRISTHIMVGFPGETNSDFNKTVELVKRLKFFDVVVNEYTDRPNVFSAGLEPKLPESTIRMRAGRVKRILHTRIVVSRVRRLIDILFLPLVSFSRGRYECPSIPRHVDRSNAVSSSAQPNQPKTSISRR